MKKFVSLILAVVSAATLTLSAAAGEIIAPPTTEPSTPADKTYYVTNYDTDKRFDLTFSKALDYEEPDISGNVNITLLTGGSIRCNGDYGFLCVGDPYNGNRWMTYDGPQDAAFFASRHIAVTPTRVLQIAPLTNSQYASGYTWTFQKEGIYQITAGCGFYKDLDTLKFTVNVVDVAPGTITTDFRDVHDSDYFASPVTWAVEQGITEGTTPTTFSPNIPCTNAQIMTFIWRANDRTGSRVDFSETGVADGLYYTQAVRWAVDAGIIPNAPFDANKPCTRAMAMEYLWKLEGSPLAGSTKFTDVDPEASYADAISWAVHEGIANGDTNKTFAPDTICTRAQIVTFLYRSMVN